MKVNFNGTIYEPKKLKAGTIHLSNGSILSNENIPVLRFNNTNVFVNTYELNFTLDSGVKNIVIKRIASPYANAVIGQIATVTTSSSITLFHGDTIEVTANANDGYIFTDTEPPYGTQYSKELTITSDSVFSPHTTTRYPDPIVTVSQPSGASFLKIIVSNNSAYYVDLELSGVSIHNESDIGRLAPYQAKTFSTIGFSPYAAFDVQVTATFNYIGVIGVVAKRSTTVTYYYEGPLYGSEETTTTT